MSEALSQVNIYSFIVFIVKIIRLEKKLLKDKVIDVMENWGSAIFIAMPRNMFPQNVFLSIARCIEFHCVCCAVGVRNVCELNTFYHFCCKFGIVSVVDCYMLIIFVVDQRNF